MAEKKARVEPEVSFPEGNGGGNGNGNGTGVGSPGGNGGASTHPGAGGETRPSVEDLVPGLGDEIERQDGADPADAGLATDRIIELEAEVSELRDKWTRALAEAENVRRRAERDRRDAEAYGGTRLARDVLAVWDNLERALKAADDQLKADHAPFIEGVELTQRELLNAFGKHKIAKVTPEKGEKFDPNRHQAMFEAPIPGAEPGTIIEVMQDGFTIAERLLRPALVGVARAAPESAAAPEPASRPAPDADANAGPASAPQAEADAQATGAKAEADRDDERDAASGRKKSGDGDAAA